MIHPLTVGIILATAGAVEDVIIAGILHDTIEDSTEENKVTFEMVKEHFGQTVAELVLSVTEQNKSLPWEDRKKEALDHIKHFSDSSLLLKSADIISNTRDIIDDYQKEGDETFKRFGGNKEKFLNGYANAIKAILERPYKNPLTKDLREIVKILERILSV